MKLNFEAIINRSKVIEIFFDFASSISTLKEAKKLSIDNFDSLDSISLMIIRYIYDILSDSLLIKTHLITREDYPGSEYLLTSMCLRTFIRNLNNTPNHLTRSICVSFINTLIDLLVASFRASNSNEEYSSVMQKEIYTLLFAIFDYNCESTFYFNSIRFDFKLKMIIVFKVLMLIVTLLVVIGKNLNIFGDIQCSIVIMLVFYFKFFKLFYYRNVK
jgi:hypothetical protein